MDTLEQHCRAAHDFGNQHLLVNAQGQVLDLKTGYIPLLSTFTHEDKAAKGLRKAKTSTDDDVPVHFSALELVRDNKVLLLHGESGSGKTTFAKHLCYRIAGRPPPLPTAVIRNEAGHMLNEDWNTAGFLARYFAIEDTESLRVASQQTIPNLVKSVSGTSIKGVVFVLDGLDHAKDCDAALIEEAMATIKDAHGEDHRLLLLADTRALSSSTLTSAVVKHSLLPLLVAQRRQKSCTFETVGASEAFVALGQAAANPAIYALALQAGDDGRSAEAAVDAWLSAVTQGPEQAQQLERIALQQLHESLGLPHEFRDDSTHSPQLTASTRVRSLLAARYLASVEPAQTALLLQINSLAALDTVRSVLARFEGSPDFPFWATSLVEQPGHAAQRAAILLAEHGLPSSSLRELVLQQVLAVVCEGRLSRAMRLEAGCALSNLGDSRDLMALADIPAGIVNAELARGTALQAYRISRYPIVTREYARFVVATGRAWSSPDKHISHRQNVPATDLTLYDANAYCDWLTTQWRDAGKISSDEHVRLPTEPEWVRASRGGLQPIDPDLCVYPWGTLWLEDACNSEETGLNQTCSVGLFPKGISQYGCHDMAGNVWEWCTTLWGEHMSTPSYSYTKWQHDGRADLAAPAKIRRVLRGGCFSSSKLKANCGYRGSLEANGFWRGNGFRIVVASHG